MTIEAATSYSDLGKLMPNYGWVQNTSNLAAVRDSVVELMPLDSSINHNHLMAAIRDYRLANGEIRNKWVWDARCRIKAANALGFISLRRDIQGYCLTDLGLQLREAAKGTKIYRGKRVAGKDEIELFKRGMLTSPPVIRVLDLLNKQRLDGGEPLSKYDIGAELGFLADQGFTHFDAEWVAKQGFSFNDKEGDADKWARTILSWLVQVGWANEDEPIVLHGKRLKRYTANEDVYSVLKTSALSSVKNITEEMLCSAHHPLCRYIQSRRAKLLSFLKKRTACKFQYILQKMQEEYPDYTEENLEFDLLNLQRMGLRIAFDKPYVRLSDAILLDARGDSEKTSSVSHEAASEAIQHFVIKYEDTIPAKHINQLIMNVHTETGDSTIFEEAVYQFFRFLGYAESEKLGQGNGRVADVLAKYKNPESPLKSYALIIDAKAYNSYTLPAGDVRKMKEYIQKHSLELMEEHYSKFAFAFVSWSFNLDENKLLEIADETSCNGVAIDLPTLFELGSRIISRENPIEAAYPIYTSNSILKLAS